MGEESRWSTLTHARHRAGTLCPQLAAFGKQPGIIKEMKLAALLHHLTIDLLGKAVFIEEGRPRGSRR